MPMDDMNAVQIRTMFEFNIESALNQLTKIETRVKSLNNSLMSLELTSKKVADSLNLNLQNVDILSRIQQETANTANMAASQINNMGSATAQNIGLTAKQAAEQKRMIDINNKLLRQEELKLKAEAQSERLIGQKLKNQQAALKIEQTQAKTAQQTAEAEQDSFNIVESQFERRMSWFVVGTLFFGAMSAIRNAVSTMTKVEMGMTEIARITEDVTFNFEEMRTTLIDLGVQYGTTFDTVQDVSLRWAQAGYNVSDSLKLTEASLLALNTAELNAEQATTGLIAIMTQWNLEADQLVPTIDKINKVADDYAITSQDLIDALTRSSGAAKLMNLSLEQTMGILTVIREATGRTGREIGNAVNSILSFMQRPVALKGFEKLGIEVYADKAKTQFRNVFDILEELAARWPEVESQIDIQAMFEQAAVEAGLYSEAVADATDTLDEFNDVQAAQAAGLAAGVYRRNYLVALLENFSKVQDVVNTALNAEGYSMRENARTMDTLQKQYESLKASLEGLAVALGDAGLLDVLKGMVESTTYLVDSFNKLDETVRNMLINFGFIYGLVKLITPIVKMFGVGATATAAGAAATAGAAASATAGATAATATAAKAAKVLPGYWKIIGVGAVAAITAIHSNIKQANKEAEEHIKTVGELGEKYFELKDSVANIAVGTKAYSQNQGQLRNIMEDIVNTQPTLLKNFDELGNVTEINEEALAEEIDTYKKLTEEQKKQTDELQRSAEIMAGIEEEKDKNIKNLEEESELLEQLIELYERSAESSQNRKNAEEGLVNILGEKTWEEIKASGNIRDAIDKELEKRNDLIKAQRQNAIDSLKIEKERLKGQLEIIDAEITKLKELKEEREKALQVTKTQTTGEKIKQTLKETVPSPSNVFGRTIDILKQIPQVIKRNLELPSLSDPEVRETVKKSIDNSFKTIEEEYEDASQELVDELKKRQDIMNAINEIMDQINKTAVEGKETVVDNAPPPLIDNLDKYDLVIDRYMMLNAILDNINIALDKNATLESRVEGIDRINFIEQENNLLKKKQDILHAINEERRKEQSELKKYLTTQGVKIDETGNILNLEEVLKSRAAVYDIMPEETEEQKEAKKRTKEAIDELQEKAERFVDLVFREIPEASATWYDMLAAIEANNKEIESLNKEVQDISFDKLESELNHWTKMGSYSIQQQIDQLRQLYLVKKLTTEEQWDLDEDVFNLYKDAIEEQQDAIKDAYDERIDMIKKESEAKIKAQEDIIESIEKELELIDKREEEYDFEKNMSELKEDLAYWSVRTSEEARKKVAETNKKIAELEHDREIEIKTRELEDKKSIAEDEIDAIKETTDAEIEKWENAYKAVEEAFDEHYTNIVARAATTSKEVFQQWVDNYIVPMQEALETSKASYLEFAAEKLKLGTSKLPSHDWGMTDEDYQTMMSNKERWWQLYEQGYTQEMNAEMQLLNRENDTIRRKYGRNPALGEYPKFHEGAKTLSYGIAMFKPGELIFPPELSIKLEALISVLNRKPLQQMQSIDQTYDNRRNIQIDKLLNIENNRMEDEIDSELLSRELRRVILAIS